MTISAKNIARFYAALLSATLQAVRHWLRLLTQSIFATLFFATFCAQAADNVTIAPTVTTAKTSITLNEEQINWLNKKKTIVVGISPENFEPYEILQGKNLKGIVADYIYLITESLGLTARAVIYPDQTAAVHALENGEIDVLGRGLLADHTNPALSLSTPYTLSSPVIVGRGAELEFPKVKVEGKVAFSGEFVPMREIVSAYRYASPIKYDSVLEALHAVEYQQQSWFIGDPITVGYYKGQGELPHIHAYPIKDLEKNGYSFIFNANNSTLLTLFDETINNTASVQKDKIINYWSSNSYTENLTKTVFSVEEKQWLSTHPEIKVAINGSLPPYSFYDETGELRGIVVDLLAEISQAIGINFKVVDVNSLADMEESLLSKQSDMALTLLPNPDRAQYLRFTEPFLFNSFALVSEKNSSIVNVRDLKGKKVAIQRSNFVAEKVMQIEPSIQLIKKDSQLDSLVAVANGEVDAAITLLPTATYLIRQYFQEDLKVSTSLPDFAANLPISIRIEQYILYSVMEKMIDHLGPNYINGLMNNWKAATPAKASVWKEYVSKFRLLSIAAVISSLLLLSLILYLYIKRRRILQDVERFEFRSTLLDSIPMAIAVRDLEGRFVFCNQVFYAQLKVSPQQILGKLTSEFPGLDVDQAKEHQRLYFQALALGVADQRQLDAEVNGVHLTFRQWDRPYTDKNGNIAGLISGYADMTSNVLLLQQLRDAHDKAVKANEAKSRFLAVMSHEIRTPLNAIIGLLELTIQRIDRGDAWDRDDLQVAYGSSKSLIELIDDILDLAKIESGNMTLVAQRCNLSEIIRSVTRVFSGVARQKGLYLQLEEDLQTTDDISLDAARLKQVLSNIISNAIKFTDCGGLSIKARCFAVAENTHIHIEIADSGIGIAEEDQQLLFSPFTQATHSSNSRGGTGLGLAICRQLISIMGGTLELHSSYGKGTTVCIDLTAPKLQAASVAPVSSDKDKPHMKRHFNVLLVDDHPANRLLLGQQLEFLGHSVQEAEDGVQAMELLNKQEFDLIITDCSMPIMDGYELTRRWRAHEKDAGITPCWIMGFTANAQPEERIRCIEAGMDGCLFKPVSLAELETCIENLEPRHSGGFNVLTEEKNHDADLIDKASVAALTNGNEKLTTMLLTQLHTSNELDLQQLQERINQSQWKELSLLAHRLKGVARLINSKPLIEATEAYEEGFANNSSDLRIKALAVAICQTMEKLQASLSTQLKPKLFSKNN